MIKREISFLKNFILPIALVHAAIYFRFYYIENPDRIIQKRESLQVLIEGAKKIKKIWHEGDIRGDLKSGKLDCQKEFKDFEKVDSTFFRCNLRFLECVLRESFEKEIVDFPRNIYPMKLDNGHYTKPIVRSSMEGPKIPNYGALINLAYGGESLKIIFEDSCRETVLPPRVYSYGVEKNDWRWDNLGRLLVIDKYLVTNKDINEWNAKFSFKNLSYPATKLKFEEMQNFCLWKGKQVSQAHIFDAASFLPGNLRNINPKIIFKSPYPWTRIKMSSFLYSAQRYADFVFDKKHCSQIYSNECLGKAPFEDFEFSATTWLGLSGVLGGPMEAMRNPVEARENLFASSYHFPASSMYHQLGKRSYWDGLGFSWDHFSLEQKAIGENALIGFRCMRTISSAN